MLRASLIALALLVVAAGIVWYTVPSLTLFNALVPKDGGSQRVARDIAYGGDPLQALDIYAPDGARAGGELPVIVFIHGGGWRSGDRQGYAFAGRALAAQGFVTVVIGYRLVPQVRFPGFVEDGAAAVRWVRGHIGDYGGDGEAITLIGHSAGGYIAAMLALDERWLGEDRAAITGWVGMAAPTDFLPLDKPSTITAFGEAPDLPATQPINYANAGDPPALIAHGADDDTVNPRQSARLAARLTAAGVAVTHKIYPGIGHNKLVTALSRWTRGSAPILSDIATFIRANDAKRRPSLS